MEEWYIVRDMKLRKDMLATESKKDVIKFLSDKNLSQYRIDILYYEPAIKEVHAEEFMREYM